MIKLFLSLFLVFTFSAVAAPSKSTADKNVSKEKKTEQTKVAPTRKIPTLKKKYRKD